MAETIEELIQEAEQRAQLGQGATPGFNPDAPMPPTVGLPAIPGLGAPRTPAVSTPPFQDAKGVPPIETRRETMQRLWSENPTEAMRVFAVELGHKLKVRRGEGKAGDSPLDKELKARQLQRDAVLKQQDRLFEGFRQSATELSKIDDPEQLKSAAVEFGEQLKQMGMPDATERLLKASGRSEKAQVALDRVELRTKLQRQSALLKENKDLTDALGVPEKGNITLDQWRLLNDQLDPTERVTRESVLGKPKDFRDIYEQYGITVPEFTKSELDAVEFKARRAAIGGRLTPEELASRTGIERRAGLNAERDVKLSQFRIGSGPKAGQSVLLSQNEARRMQDLGLQLQETGTSETLPTGELAARAGATKTAQDLAEMSEYRSPDTGQTRLLSGEEVRGLQQKGENWIKVRSIQAYPPTSPFAKKELERFSELRGKLESQAELARIRVLPGLALAKASLEAAKPGAFGDTRAMLSSTAHLLGLDPKEIPLLGDPASQETLQFIGSFMMPTVENVMKGNISNTELAVFLRSFPQMVRTKEGNQVVIATMRAAAERSVQAQRVMDDIVRKHGSDLDVKHTVEFNERMAAYDSTNPVVTPEARTLLRKSAERAPISIVRSARDAPSKVRPEALTKDQLRALAREADSDRAFERKLVEENPALLNKAIEALREGTPER